jgi:hypothetical protein
VKLHPGENIITSSGRNQTTSRQLKNKTKPGIISNGHLGVASPDAIPQKSSASFTQGADQSTILSLDNTKLGMLFKYVSIIRQ